MKLMLLLTTIVIIGCQKRSETCGKWFVSGTNDNNWTTDVTIRGADSIQWVNPAHVIVFIDGKQTNIFSERIKVGFIKCEEDSDHD